MRILALALLLLPGCVKPDPKFKDSEAIAAIETFDVYTFAQFNSYADEWNISLHYNKPNVVLSGKGRTFGEAYDNAIKQLNKL